MSSLVPTPVLQSLASVASTVVGQLSSAPAASCVFPALPAQPSPTLSLADYDANPTTGFVPAHSPLTRLPSAFEAWEAALDLVNCGHDSILSLGEDLSPDAIAKRPSSRSWRDALRAMPILSIESMNGNARLQQRAHHVLAFLVHFFYHSIPQSASAQDQEPLAIPASIAIPLVAVSNALGLAPILTYADTVLWNIAPRDATKPLAPGNLRVLTTFSGTDDEDAFYQCCANIELFGTDALSIMTSYENLNLRDSARVRVDALRSVASGLEELTTIVDDLTSLLKGCHGSCSPKVFYDLIRPWFRGSSSADIPWVFEGVDKAQWKHEEWAILSGPSGGQSTLMHSLDVFLDVDHSMEKTTDSRTPIDARQGNDRLFMRRMQKYMPVAQRAFLDRLASSTFSLRQLAVSLSSSASPAANDVVHKYNAAVGAIRRFRDAHLKIACVYVVAQARKAAMEAHTIEVNNANAPSASTCPVGAMLLRLAAEGDADLLAVCPMSGLGLNGAPTPTPTETQSAKSTVAAAAPIRGTGGTELMCLLRSCRDATTRAMIPTSLPARR